MKKTTKKKSGAKKSSVKDLNPKAAVKGGLIRDPELM